MEKKVGATSPKLGTAFHSGEVVDVGGVVEVDIWDKTVHPLVPGR